MHAPSRILTSSPASRRAVWLRNVQGDTLSGDGNAGAGDRSRASARIIRETDLKAYYISDFELVPSVDGAFEYVAPFWNWLFCRLSPSELAARLSATGFRVRNGG